jgi:hypothetical protein
MARRFGLLRTAVVLCGLFLCSTSSQSASQLDPLMSYAVDVGGSGIYLGRGFIITASHVGGKLGEKRSVGLGGQSISGKWIKVGTFEDTDVSIMELDDVILPNGIRQLRPIRLCSKPLKANQPVLVVAPGNVAPARIVSPDEMFKGDPRQRKFSSLISDPETTGNSGSGVFDATQRCLLGIISRNISINYTDLKGDKISKRIGKYFVPAAEIRAFSKPISLLNEFFR